MGTNTKAGITLEDKFRPTLSALEVIGLVRLLKANYNEALKLGIQPVITKLEVLEFKIRNNVAKPAYITTGIPTGGTKEIIGIDSDGDISMVKSPAQIMREKLEKEIEQHKILNHSGLVAKFDFLKAKEIDLIIERNVAIGNPICMDAVNAFYAQCNGIIDPTRYWKFIKASEDLLSIGFSKEQIGWIIHSQQSGE